MLFDEEWWWVFGYGVAVVAAVVANALLLISILRNGFLHTDANRCFFVLATRNVLRAVLALVVLYATRWTHNVDRVFNATKLNRPLLCDILCSVDTFLLTLPMYTLVGAVVHMFTRFPSPHHHNSYDVDHHHHHHSGLERPRAKCCWFSLCLPTLPVLMSALIALPIPLMHLSHPLAPVPEKRICVDVSRHLTFDAAVFILGYGLPVLLVFFLVFGLIFRRCLQCSSSHCCNSWCKEEAVFAQFYFLAAIAQFPMFFSTLDDLAEKFGVEEISYYVELTRSPVFLGLGRPEVARAAEMVVTGFALPLLLYMWMPTYRKFATEPDPDDASINRKKQSQSGSMKDVRVKALNDYATTLLQAPPPTPTPATPTSQKSPATKKSTDGRDRKCQ